MNKRAEIANRVWLSGFSEDDSPREALVPPVRDSLADLLHTIGGGHRYSVEMRLDVDTYYVRCYPPSSNRPIGQPPVCLSYSGSSLRNILAAATLDLARLRNPENRWLVATRELVRWVA